MEEKLSVAVASAIWELPSCGFIYMDQDEKSKTVSL